MIIENQIVNTNDDHDMTKFYNSIKSKDFIKKDEYIVKNYKDFYFLTKDGEYLAHIQDYNDKLVDKTIFTVGAFSKERGMYKILIDMLMKSPKIKNISSDSIMSTSLYNFYKKLFKTKEYNLLTINSNDEVIGKSTLNDLVNPDLRITISK